MRYVGEYRQDHLKKRTQQSTFIPVVPLSMRLMRVVDLEVAVWLRRFDPQCGSAVCGRWMMSGTAKVSFTQLTKYGRVR